MDGARFRDWSPLHFEHAPRFWLVEKRAVFGCRPPPNPDFSTFGQVMGKWPPHPHCMELSENRQFESPAEPRLGVGPEVGSRCPVGCGPQTRFFPLRMYFL